MTTLLHRVLFGALAIVLPMRLVADDGRDWPTAKKWEKGKPVREMQRTCFYPPGATLPNRKFLDETTELLDCRLDQFETLGNIDQRIVYSARYAYRVEEEDLPPHDLHFAAVYESDKTHQRLRPIFTFFDDDCTSEVQLPKLVATKYGPWLKVDFVGPPACWRTSFYFFSEGAWREVDFKLVSDELRASIGERFPGGGTCPVHDEDAIENGFVYESSVRLPADCRACSTGGNVRAELAFNDGVMHVVRAEYTPPTLFDLLLHGSAVAVQEHISKHPEELSSQNSAGQTPLTEAVDSNGIQSVKILLAAGADPREKDGRGESALEIATRRGPSAMLEILQSYGQPPPAQPKVAPPGDHGAD